MTSIQALVDPNFDQCPGIFNTAVDPIQEQFDTWIARGVASCVDFVITSSIYVQASRIQFIHQRESKQICTNVCCQSYLVVHPLGFAEGAWQLSWAILREHPSLPLGLPSNFKDHLVKPSAIIQQYNHHDLWFAIFSTINHQPSLIMLKTPRLTLQTILNHRFYTTFKHM